MHLDMTREPQLPTCHMGCPLTFQSTVGLQGHVGPAAMRGEPVLVTRAENDPLGNCI